MSDDDGRRRLLREGVVIAIGHGATIVARLVGLRLLTGAVGPAVFGEANLLIGLVTLGTTLFCAPTLQAILRHYPDADRRGRIAELRRVALRQLVPGTALVCAALLLGGTLWWVFAASGPSLAAFVVLAAIAVADVRRLFEANQLNAARRQGVFSIWVAADAWARPLAAVAVIALLGPSTLSMLLGFAVGAFAVNESIARLIRRPLVVREPDPDWEQRLRRDVWHFVAPLIPLAVLNWITSLSDRYVLAGIAGAGATGLYVAAYGLASQPFLAVANVGVTLFRPVLFQAVARSDVGRLRRTLVGWLAVLTAVYVLGWLLLWWFAEPIVHLLLAEEYWGATALVPWIAAAYALQGLTYVFDTMIYARGATRRFLPLKILGAVSAFVLYLVLIPRWGSLGAAIATFASLGLTCMATALLAGTPASLVEGRDPGERPENQ